MPDTPSAVHEVDIALRWGDLDAYGHVNNVEFLRLLEEARVRAFNDWFGREHDVVGRGLLVASQSIDYLLPLGYDPAGVVVRIWIIGIGGASFDVGCEVVSPDGAHTYARARTTLVSYDFQRSAPRKFTAHERDSLQGHRGPEPQMRGRR